MPRRNTSLVAVVTAVLLVMALGSAVAGPWEMEERDLSWLTDWLESDDTLPTFTLPEFEIEPGDPVPTSPGPDLGWLRYVFIGLVAVAAALLVVWLIRRYRQTDLPEQVVPQRHEGVAAQSEAPEVPVLQKGLRDASRMLEEGIEPDDAIISAWMTLEGAAADAGVRRRPAQTPTEFAVAILDRTVADSEAIQRLLALYRRARFSQHRSTAEDVAEAVRCLRVLMESWDRAEAGAGR